MLLRGSSSRWGRGSTPNRSSNRSRGQGSTSRGASSSSSKSKHELPIPTGHRAMYHSSNTYHSNYGGRNFKNHYSNYKHTGTSSSGPDSPNPFEQERAENAAKRIQRGQNGTMVNGRGGRGASRGGGQTNRSVRFADPPEESNPEPFAVAGSTGTANPFAPKAISSPLPFGSQSAPSYNPFAAKPMTNPFATKITTNPAPSGSENTPPFNPFAQKSTANPSVAKPTPVSLPFGSQNASPVNPFAPKPTTNPSTPRATTRTASPFGLQNNTSFTAFAPKPGGITSSANSMSSSSPFGGQRPFFGNSLTATTTQSKPAPGIFLNGTRLNLTAKIEQVLNREGIVPPNWPHIPPEGMKYNDPAMIKLYNDYKSYRDKVRASLIRAGLLDDPDKPKKLSEALEFKGTCEDMCPEFERASRIMDGRIDKNEEGGPENMVKALARSAAGQDAPLPSDIRTTGAMRRTVDHLFHDILGNSELESVHGFVWDRTRAIRRDFVFHSSMSSVELVDQVYCLEHITRFHVTALHQMSKLNLSADKFSEQQELEQLGKTLLSLIHTYEDCKAQRVACENEAEFRAYYVLFNSHDPGILDTVQTWGYKFWKGSEDIKIAIELVEALQNTWELHGPLKPHSATIIAQNGFSRFFTIIEDRKISYTLACFAEIFFNDIRKSVLKTILGSYRKQRDQTKDWTVSKLNTYLRFDTEEEVAPFLEAHGLRTDEIDGEEYLSFEVTEISDPWPKLKQTHSEDIVERKRGNFSLPEVIDRTVSDESVPEESAGEDEDEGLFVKDDSVPSQSLPEPVEEPEEAQQARKDSEVVSNSTANQQAPVQGNAPRSLFDRIGSHSPATFKNGFSNLEPSVRSSSSLPTPAKAETSSVFGVKPTDNVSTAFTAAAPSSFFAPQAAKPAQSIFSQPPKETAAPATPSILSFSPQPSMRASAESAPQGSFSFSNPPAISGTTQETKTTFFPSQQSSKAPSPTFPANDEPAKYRQPSSPFGHLSPPAKKDQPKTPFGNPLQPAAFSSTSTTPPSVPKANKTLNQHTLQSTPTSVPRNFPPTPTVADKESVASQPKALFSAKPQAPVDRSKGYDALSQWMTLGEDGLIDQFTAFSVEQILRRTMQSYMEQEAARAAQEAENQARMEADRFRYRSLATKFGYRWRELAHRLWMKRKGREARQVRREMAESMRASKSAQSANIVEDFKASVASTSNRRRDSLESLLNATGVLNGVHDPEKEARAIVRSERAESTNKRQRSERSSTSHASSMNRHKRGKSENPLRRSILSDPSYLNGDSRIHLMSNYGAQEEGRRQHSGVRTDYFRLKARGITTLPDGTPLASSVAKNIIHQKHSFDGIQKSSTPQSTKQQPVVRSVPAKLATDTEDQVNGNNRENLEALKFKAKAFISEEKKARQKRALMDDEEELFERAKRIREQMDEGAKWYRKEIERETASRSVS